MSRVPVTVTYQTANDYVETYFNLTAVSMTRLEITTPPNKTAYRYEGERIDYTGIVVTATYDDGTTRDVTSLCTFSVAAGKVFDPDTDTSIEISYSEGSNERSVYLRLTQLTFTLSVATPPTKAEYFVGEQLDLAGLEVTATWSDGVEDDVTSRCTITPTGGTVITDDTTRVEISMENHDTERTTYQRLTVHSLISLTVTAPTTTAYRITDTVDFTGLVVMANYSGSLSVDVTQDCVLSFDDGDPMPAQDTTVTVTYTSYTETETGDFELRVITLTSLTCTNPTVASYRIADTVSYAGVVVTATYSDRSTDTVTASCTMSLANGSPMPAQDTTVVVSYTNVGGETETTDFELYVITLDEIRVTTMPTKSSYYTGETISYDGMVVTSYWSNGTTRVESGYTIVASSATMPQTDMTVTVVYISPGNETETTTLTLTVISLSYIQITTPPNKTTFFAGQTIDFTGMVVIAHWSNNSTFDVSSSVVSSVNVMPPADCTAVISYSAGGITETDSLYLTARVVSFSFSVKWLCECTVYGESCSVDYGDGASESKTRNPQYPAMGISHRYADPDEEYIAEITGCVERIEFWTGDFAWLPEVTEVFDPLPELLQYSTNLYNVFAYVSALTTLPSNLLCENPQLTTFDECFYGCTGLATVPSSLFSYCPDAESFHIAFRASGITTIPSGLFSACTKATNYNGAFYRCPRLTTIPEGLFSNCPSGTNFVSCFSECTGLTTLSTKIFKNLTSINVDFCFKGCTALTTITAPVFENCTFSRNQDIFSGCSRLASIPSNLFQSFSSATTMYGMFAGCTALATIPDALFQNCTQVRNFGSTFNNGGLTSIPANLFRYNTNARIFSLCFQNCVGLTSIPENLFANCPNITTFQMCFDGCTNLTGNAPRLWELFPNANGDRCFRGCTGLSNYADIPSGWK